MKIGRNLPALAAEIARQSDTKRDFVASTADMRMVEGTNRFDGLLQLGEYDVRVNDLAHNQIGTHVGIPAAYYDKMRSEAPALLVDNVNTWFRKYPAPRMVRTLDGSARAFLSDRFRPLENVDLAEAVLPTLMDLQLDIVSCEVTEKRLYIKCVDPKIQRDIPTGKFMGDGGHTIFDTVCPAMTISNSEVGFGALSVEVGTLTRACTNLAFFAQRGLRKYHIGTKHDMGDDLYRLLSDETRKATDKAVWLQIRDTVKNAFNEARFDSLVEEIAGTAKQPILGNPVKVVEMATKKFALSEKDGTSILRHLIQGGDLTRYGLSQAVTRTAEDVADYDHASNMERFGAKLIELPQGEWKTLATAE